MNYTVSTIEKIDERFDFNQIDAYIKSIQLSLNGFSYIVSDPATHEHLALRHYDFGTEVSLQRAAELLDELLQHEDILGASHGRINLAYLNRPWAMVPEMLFIKEKAGQLIDVNFKKDDFSRTTYIKVPGTSFIMVGRLPNILYKIFDNKNIAATILPHQAAFIHNALQTLQYQDVDRAFFMEVNDQFFDLLYIDNHLVKFYNNFAFKQYADVLYYTLAVMEKLYVDPAECHIFLQGNELVKEIIPFELKKHIRYVYLDKDLFGQSYSHHFEQLPLYQYKLLTGIFSCAL